jgi:hypothetical protein
MCRVELTRLKWLGQDWRCATRVRVDLEAVAAQAQTAECSVLYLRSGEKLFIQETLEEIERLRSLKQVHSELSKRCKREIRKRRSAGLSTNQAFASAWEEVSAEAKMSEDELATLYQELLTWTKRWLK